jgi:hypothetical protein
LPQREAKKLPGRNGTTLMAKRGILERWVEETMDEDIFEMCLPEFLRHDIDALVEGYANPDKATILDCLYNEVQGSINSAMYGNYITEREAQFLRDKYLYSLN